MKIYGTPVGKTSGKLTETTSRAPSSSTSSTPTLSPDSLFDPLRRAHTRSASPPSSTHAMSVTQRASLPENPSLRVAMREKARRDTLADLKQSFTHPDSHRVMWHDSMNVRITTREPKKLKQDIDDMVAAFGGLDAAIVAFGGTNPYSLYHPVCGNSAGNMFKLLTEKNEAIDPTRLKQWDGATFSAHLDQFDVKKNHIMMINDKRLGHKYLVDLPASHGGPRKAYIIQSDLGDGALPALKINDWIDQRANESVSAQDLRKLIGPELSHMPPDEQRELLALTLEVDKDPTRIDLSKLHLNRPCTFAYSEYDFEQFRHNAKYVTEYVTGLSRQ